MVEAAADAAGGMNGNGRLHALAVKAATDTIWAGFFRLIVGAFAILGTTFLIWIAHTTNSTNIALHEIEAELLGEKARIESEIRRLEVERAEGDRFLHLRADGLSERLTDLRLRIDRNSDAIHELQQRAIGPGSHP